MTPRIETFCVEIIKGKSQSAAYRIAFKPKKMLRKTVHEKASRLMRTGKVRARVAELMQPVVAAAQLTREESITDAIRLYRGDVRKLFDTHGNAIDIPNLSDSEADCIESFESVEDFTKVKHNDGSAEAVPTGYTKKIKFTSRKSRHEYLGKALGYYKDKIEHSGVVTLEQAVMASMKLDKKDQSACEGDANEPFTKGRRS